MECQQAGSTQRSALQRRFASVHQLAAESTTGGEERWRGMASLVPGWLKGVPRMLSSLLGLAPRGKRGCDVHQLLARFLPRLPAA